VKGVPPRSSEEREPDIAADPSPRGARSGVYSAGRSTERPARTGPIFLERSNYRYRRLTDAVRFLPVMGAILWMVPLLWTRGETMNSAALLYVFGIWLVLVVVAALLARGLGPAGWSDEPTDPRLGQRAEISPGAPKGESLGTRGG